MELPCLLDVPEARYHADDIGFGDRPALSASIATTLLNESPRHAWLRHPKFGNVKKEATSAMERGKLLHGLLLGKGQVVEVCHYENWRSKAAQAEYEAAEAKGLLPVLSHEFTDAEAVVRDLREQITAAGIDLRAAGTLTEAVVVWEEETSYGPILCRGMYDHVVPDRAVIHDLKTGRTGAADPRAMRNKIADHGLDVQYAAYTSAMRELRPDLAGREDFIWLLAEELPAPCPQRAILTVARPDGNVRELGRQRWARACELWAKCLHESNWPAYSSGPVAIEAPVWAMQQEEMQ